jgi:hypothetical protein
VAFEHGGFLEFAADTQIGDLRLVELGEVGAAVEIDFAVIGAGLAGDDVHHGGLAGAVGADDRQHLAGVDDDREMVQRLEAVEGNGDAVEIEHGAGFVGHSAGSGYGLGLRQGGRVLTGFGGGTRRFYPCAA